MLDVVAGRLLDPGVVIIEGDRIVATQSRPPDPLPTNAVRVDAAGLTLVPGLIDLAVEAVPGAGIDTDFLYSLGLAFGVTGYRSIDARLPWTVQQRERIARGVVLAPRLWVAGPLVTSGDATWGSPAARDSVTATFASRAEDVGQAVARQAAAGTDWVRLADDVPADAVARAVSVARRSRVRISAGAGGTSMLQLIQLGVDAIDGLGAPIRSLTASDVDSTATVETSGETVMQNAWLEASRADLDALATRLAKSRTAVAPMLRVAGEAVLPPRQGRLASELALLPEPLRQARIRQLDRRRATDSGRSRTGRAWEARQRFVRMAARAGARIVAASGARADGWPAAGLALHHELALLVDSGVDPAVALRAATSRAAEILGAGTSLGQVRPGFGADCFAVEGDPLTDVAALQRVRFVVRGGELLDREQLLARARRAAGGR